MNLDFALDILFDFIDFLFLFLPLIKINKIIKR